MTSRAAERPAIRVGRPLRIRSGTWLVFPAITYLVALAVFPLLYSLALAFLHYRPITNDFVFRGLDNFIEVVRDKVFWQASGNTVIFTISAVVLELIFGVLLAVFFNRKLRFAPFVRGLLMLPMLITPVVVGLMWRALLNPDWGLINWALRQFGLSGANWTGDPKLALLTLICVDVWQWSPFVFVVVFARLQSLPEEVFEAAQVDGASRWQTFVRITLPLLGPAIVFATVFRGVDAFRAFDLVFGLTYGGPGYSSITLSLYAFQLGFTYSRLGYASAMVYVMVIAAVLGTTVLFRFVRLRREEVV